MEEARDGDDLKGSYSYVDADGSLVTVNYKAGPMGYTETRDEQAGFVQMRARPVRTQAVAVTDNSAAVAAARAQAAQAAAARLAAARQEAARIEAARIEAARQSSLNTNSIVSQVISSLQPLISQTVEGVISSSSSTRSLTGSRLGAVSSGGDIASTFGNGGLAVSVETPDFQFAF